MSAVGFNATASKGGAARAFQPGPEKGSRPTGLWEDIAQMELRLNQSTRCSPTFPGCGDAVAGTLGDESAFEVRDGAEEVSRRSSRLIRWMPQALRPSTISSSSLSERPSRSLR